MPDEAADTTHSDDGGNVVFLGPDKYRIEEKLGEGSFGIVYKGVKLPGESPLHVAIKFVRSVLRLTLSKRLTLN
jgi:serine/threonine protein kinase